MRKLKIEDVPPELWERLKRALHKTMARNLEAFRKETEELGYRREEITTLGGHYRSYVTTKDD